MPVIQNFRIVDDFYLWEAYQGINNGRQIQQFRIVDNYYLYLVILAASTGGGYTTQSGIIASPVQTQAAATVLTKEFNRADFAAADGDTVKFSPATVGKKQTFQNNTGFDVDCYPAIGENFLGLADNTLITIADENELTYICYDISELTLV